ncbi:hypothetical protein C8A05DRAFT_14815, partial [Staphylotrichum tortipilum]
QEIQTGLHRMGITRPEPGSLYDIIRHHARYPVYLPPSKWTDLHSRLLGVDFIKLPAIVKPVPSCGRLNPSTEGKKLTKHLNTLASPHAIKHIISTFFPSLRPETGNKLNLYFGQQVGAVDIPCLWKIYRDTSSDPVPALPCEEDGPVLAFVGKSQLAQRYAAASKPKDDPLARLRRLRSKLLVPADTDRDPYIVAILLAMAQAHFYRPASCTPGPFSNTALQVITYDGEGELARFVVYTAVVRATLLDRFLMPRRGPASQDSSTGMEISYTPVRVWPLLGLKERLTKALDPRITSHPDHIGFWDPLVDSPPPPMSGFSSRQPLSCSDSPQQDAGVLVRLLLALNDATPSDVQRAMAEFPHKCLSGPPAFVQWIVSCTRTLFI